MTKQAKNLRETTTYLADHKPKRDEVKKKMSARKAVRGAFDGKAFADLSDLEKDDLLKAIAISTGIISE